MFDATIAVVGAGPAGCAAAVQIKRLGVSPLLIDARGRAGGLVENAYSVENYPGLEAPLSGPELARRLRTHLNRFGVSVARGTVGSVAPCPGGWSLRVDGAQVEAEAVILAPGTEPITLPTELTGHLDGERVFYEVRCLLDRFSAPSRVVVIGGGEASFDYALSLASRGARVEILVRGERHRVAGRLVELVREVPSIRVTANNEVRRVEDTGDGLELSVAGPDGERTVRADALLAAIGRGSLVDRLLGARARDDLTRSPGLFICGDARLGSLGQVGIAVGDGLAAAAAAVDFMRERNE